ncbi:hypothetical protein GO491_03100 [Flavobacteriaceae bacterium Ap0902]|nr:hypothetical protein [Flavobacteriaceae bacterium Ap0902]
MKDLIQKLASTGDEIYAKICEVISVDSDNKTANLQPLDGSSEILDAFIQVDDNGIYLEPKTGSLVACVFVTKQLAVVVNHSEIKQLQIKIEGVEFQIDKKGFLLKKQNENLQKLMLDLIKAIKNMKFTTNTGSTIKLINTPEFTALEPRIKNLLKSN